MKKGVVLMVREKLGVYDCFEYFSTSPHIQCSLSDFEILDNNLMFYEGPLFYPKCKLVFKLDDVNIWIESICDNIDCIHIIGIEREETLYAHKCNRPA